MKVLILNITPFSNVVIPSLERSPQVEDRERVEVVHWHFINQHGLEKLKRQAEREDGQLLILPSETSEEVGALSDPTLNQPSESKDTTTEPITQEIEQENLQPTPENVAEEQMEVSPVENKDADERDKMHSVAWGGATKSRGRHRV